MGVPSVAFFGASTGVGLSALKEALAAGSDCSALCRTPKSLTDVVSPSANPNLRVIEGNALDIGAVTRCLRTSSGQLVDEVVFTIGSKLTSRMTIEDPHVCEKAIVVLLKALEELRQQGISGKPHIIVCSSTGLSRFGRDTPLIIVPIYRIVLKIPHDDKRKLEDKLISSGEAFTIVRASALVNGESTKPVRVGLEDPKSGIESRAYGYTISREDAGKWIAHNLVLEKQTRYINKTTTITY